MKNKLIKSLLLIPAMLLSACGGSSNNESSVNSQDSFESSNPNSSEDSSEPEKQYPNSVLTSPWGLEAAKASYDVLGVAVPYIENESFEYVVGVDEYGDPDIWFYAYYNTDEDAEQAYEDYLTICANKGYSGEVTTYHNFDPDTFTIIEFEYAVVDRVILEHHGIELQFLPSMRKSKPCLGIYGFTYLYVDENEYPQLAVEEFFKDPSDVPVIEDEDYTYDFAFYIDNGVKGLEIIVRNVSYDIEKWYFNELMKTEKYVIVQYSDYDDDYEEIMTEYEDYMYSFYYYAISNDKILIFYVDIAKSVFVIDMYQRTRK